MMKEMGINISNLSS
ncbi:MAG: hypothetical protein LRY50_14395, partial [Geovibrio sp.]|nr:hypothetical protein [Geovibrio sp.]